MTRVAASFVGCKVSQADGEEALAGLAAAGLQPAGDRETADVVVVHTCCVTAEAERKSRRLVRRAAAGGRRVVVAGCAAALNPGQFQGPGVTVAARPDWAELGAELADLDAGLQGGPIAGPGTTGGNGGDRAGDTPGGAAGGTTPDDAREAVVDARAPVGLSGFERGREGARRATPGARTRLVLKVQDGCGGACSYCVVRLVRGRPRSITLTEALNAARDGLECGCGEVVLSGIDLGAWRDGDARLPDLLAAIAELDGLRRVRLSSIEPRHVDERLVESLRHPRVARHLHVPLQSADDGVLRAMRRPYTLAGYLDAVGRLQRIAGGAMLSTDVIVGYPTEDEAAFARTLEALEGGLFGRAHVFAYSARPGTAAAQLPPLPPRVVKERMARALAAAEAAALAARRAALGRRAEVLVEEQRNGFWRGYSSEYIRYSLRGPARPGELVRAVADEVAGDGVVGSVRE